MIRTACNEQVLQIQKIELKGLEALDPYAFDPCLVVIDHDHSFGGGTAHVSNRNRVNKAPGAAERRHYFD